jgi:glycosyltransferase involved in cell wall biosynthesis
MLQPLSVVTQIGIANMPPYFSVIVPSYNRSRELEKCLEALSACLVDDAEIIVVDDCSTTDVSGIAERYKAKQLSCIKRGGPAAARNLGANHATGQILVFVDADVLVSPDLLKIVGEEFRNDSSLAGLFGSYDDTPAEIDFYSSFKNLLHHYVHQTSSEQASTFWTGCGAIRKSVFDALGGFNTALYSRATIEDIEFGMRLKQENHKIRLVKRLQVKHLKHWTAQSIVMTDLFRRAMPWTKLIIKTRRIPDELNLDWPSRMSAALAGCWFALILALCGRTLGWTKPSPERIVAEMAIVAAGLIFLNSGLYAFFYRKRGPEFALQAIPAHWIYLLYSGVAFFSCCIYELGRTGIRLLGRRARIAVFGRKPG